MASLGGLFVDLGINTGSSLNTLSVFSGKFLLLKNAAQQMGKIFDSVFGNVVEYSQKLSDFSATTDLDTRKLQKWGAIAEQNGVSAESLTSSLKNLQKTASIMDWGEGNISPYQILGIDPKGKDPFQLLTEIQKKIQNFDKGKQRYLMEQLGLSEDMLVLFQNNTGEFNESLVLTDKEIGRVMELKKQFTILTQQIEFGWNKVLAKTADIAISIVTPIKELAGLIATCAGEASSLFDFFDRIGKASQAAADSGSGWGKLAVALSDFGKGVSTVLGETWEYLKIIIDGMGSAIGAIIDFAGVIGSVVAFATGGASWKEVKEQFSKMTGDFSKNMTASVDAYKPATANNANVTVNQTINSNANANEVGASAVRHIESIDIAKMQGAN